MPVRLSSSLNEAAWRAPPQGEHDLRNLVRIVSACTLGLWAFAIGLLIGVFLF